MSGDGELRLLLALLAPLVSLAPTTSRTGETDGDKRRSRRSLKKFVAREEASMAAQPRRVCSGVQVSFSRKKQKRKEQMS